MLPVITRDRSVRFSPAVSSIEQSPSPTLAVRANTHQVTVLRDVIVDQSFFNDPTSCVKLRADRDYALGMTECALAANDDVGALEVAGEVRQWFLDMGVDSKDAKFRGRRGDQ